MEIRKVSNADRCEICHKMDYFDPKSNICGLCASLARGIGFDKADCGDFRKQFKPVAKSFRLKNAFCVLLCFIFYIGFCFVQVHYKYSLPFGVVIIVILLTMGLMSSIINRFPDCPSCYKKLGDLLGNYCPTCSSIIVYRETGKYHCNNCSRLKAVGRGRNLIRYCTHCGIFLDVHGL